jgi:release factor glutamine methyltransferase
MQHYYLLLQDMNLKDLEAYFITGLAPLYNEEEAKGQFLITVEHLSGLSRSQLLMNKSQSVTAELTAEYNDVLLQLQAGRPIQHIFAEAWFYGLKFKVSNAVLIPRPETEELVDWIINTVHGDMHGVNQAPVILDIGTGSGCIAITLKKNLAAAEVSALDVSAAALTVARENALFNEVQLSFIAADILTYNSAARYDVIVSNPPYITGKEKEEMHENVLGHEPHLALFVTDENPLIFYKAIADFALCNLHPNGQLFFEINEYLAEATVDMLSAKGFTTIELRQDMQGKDRMIRCTL